MYVGETLVCYTAYYVIMAKLLRFIKLETE